MAALGGKLTKKLVENLGSGRHGDGGSLYLVVDPSGARRWIVRVTVKGQRNRTGKPLGTDFGLGGADVVTLNQARERALEYRRMAKQGLNPRYNARQEIPTFEEFAQQVHIERLPTWKNAKHGQQWINTLRDYAFPKIGRMPLDSIDQPEVLMCLSPIWAEKHETAKRLAQRIKTVLDVARAKGFREGENPVTAIRDAGVLPKVRAKPKHHQAMDWKDVPAFYADLSSRNAMAAKALMFTCLSGARTGEVLGMRWGELDFEAAIWICPAERMKTGSEHRVPLTPEMLALVLPLRAMQSEYVFEGQKRHKPLSNMAMLMLLRRMGVEGVTVHGFRSTFRDWAAEVANAQREVAEMSLAHQVGSDVERAYPTIDEAAGLLEAMARTTVADQRARAIFAIAFLGALRADTLSSLRLGDVDETNRCIDQDGMAVRSKNGKSLRIAWFPIPECFEREVIGWLAFLRQRGFRASDALFPDLDWLQEPRKLFNKGPDPIPVMRTAHAVTAAFNVASKIVGQSYTPHSAKHTIAALRDQQQLTHAQRRAWSENMGHESEVTTQTHYAKFTDDERANVMAEIQNGEGNVLENFTEKDKIELVDQVLASITGKAKADEKTS